MISQVKISRVLRPILFLALGVLFWDAPLLQGQDTRLIEDERNTIEVFQQASRGVVHIDSRRAKESKFENEVRASAAGTGFVIDKQGHVLTAFHVIEGMNQIDVVLSTGRRLGAELVGTAPFLDIALLRIDVPESELLPLPMGDSRALRVGQKVIAIGNPIGLHNTLTTGVISALRRSVEGTAVDLEDALIQTDAAINPGNSGGPLLNSAGMVVGVNTAVIANTQNLGFAIPIHFARQIIPDLIEMGHPYRPQLGFSGSSVTPSVAKLFGLPVTEGFLVEEVLPGSPAALAGLRAGNRIVMVADRPYVLGGDIITAVNGQPVKAPSQIAHVLLDSRPGQMLRLSVLRQGQKVDLSIPLEKMFMQF